MKITIKTILIAILAFSSINTKAQDIIPFSIGVKGGVNLSNFTGDVEGADAKIGFNAGVTLDVALPANLYLMTGLEFATKGAKNEEFFDSDDLELDDVTMNATYTFNPMYLQVPIHLGYKIGLAPNTNLVFRAGPYVAYGIGGKRSVDLSVKGNFGEFEDIINEEIREMEKEAKKDIFGDDGLKRFDYGVGFGVGLEFGKIGVGLAYDLGLANVGHSSSNKIKNMNALMTIGYKF